MNITDVWTDNRIEIENALIAVKDAMNNINLQVFSLELTAENAHDHEDAGALNKASRDLCAIERQLEKWLKAYVPRLSEIR